MPINKTRLNSEDGLDLCNTILELLDDLPEKAEDFAESVRIKVLGIHQCIEDFDNVTLGQSQALENMLEGVKKWLR